MILIIKNSHNHYQSGATLVEAVIVMPIFLIMVFGMMEMTFVFKAKNTLNLATQEAVRKGTFANAKIGAMETALEKAMAPLYSKKDLCKATDLTENNGEKCARSIREEIDKQITGNQGAAGAITVISPSKAMIDESSGFGTEMKINAKGEYGKSDAGKTIIAIPNDNLNWRSTDTKDFTVGGKSIALNIQDANLLKIKTFWCQKLSVPGLDRIFYNTILRLNKSPEQHYCNQLSQQVGGLSKTVFGREQGYYMAIRSHAIARMQSPVFGDDLLSSAALAKATDSTTPVSSTTPPPVDNTATGGGGTGTCDPTLDPNCTTDPNGGGSGTKDSHGCYADETFKIVDIIEGTSRKVNGGFCTKASVDCTKDKNKDHKDCCETTTSISKGFNSYTENAHKVNHPHRQFTTQQLPLNYNTLGKT